MKYTRNACTIKRRFYDLTRFPGEIGALDCTHEQILSPKGPNIELFRNRNRNLN